MRSSTRRRPSSESRRASTPHAAHAAAWRRSTLTAPRRACKRLVRSDWCCDNVETNTNDLRTLLIVLAAFFGVLTFLRLWVVLAPDGAKDARHWPCSQIVTPLPGPVVGQPLHGQQAAVVVGSCISSSMPVAQPTEPADRSSSNLERLVGAPAAGHQGAPPEVPVARPAASAELARATLEGRAA